LFRIDRRHVQIAAGTASAPLGAQQTAGAQQAAKEDREQPSFSAPEIDAEAIVEAARAEGETLLAEAKGEADALVLEARQTKEDADGLLNAARIMAETILEEARAIADQEALNIRGQAWKAGHQEGFEEGRREVLEEGRRQAEDLHAFIEGLEAGREAQMARLEGDVIDLSLGVARKILGVALDREDELYKSLIQNALSQMKRVGKLTLRLPEAVAARLFRGSVATFVLGDERVTATVSGDSFMKVGECVLESDAEQVTAGLESQLAAITLAFEAVTLENQAEAAPAGL